MTPQFKEQHLDLQKTIQLKADAQKEEKRLRAERVKLNNSIGTSKTELLQLQTAQRSMKGLSAKKIEDAALKISSLIANVQTLEESVELMNKAIQKEQSAYKGYVSAENDTRACIANIILKERKADIAQIMEQLKPFWALNIHNNPLQVNNAMTFGDGKLIY